MFNTSAQVTKADHDNVKIYWRLSILELEDLRNRDLDDPNRYLEVGGINYEDRISAVKEQASYYTRKKDEKKTFIYPVVAVTHCVEDDTDIEDYSDDFINPCEDFVVKSHYYRGFRIDINNRGVIHIYQRQSDGNYVGWKFIDALITFQDYELDNDYNCWLNNAFEYVDLKYFDERGDWTSVFVHYTYDNQDRHYIAAYTSIDKIPSDLGSHEFIEEIEVPFIGDELYYVEWFRDVKDPSMRSNRQCAEESSDPYASIDLAKQDDIWKRMEALTYDRPDIELYTDDMMIATVTDGVPFRARDIYRISGSKAYIQPFPVIKD